MPRTRVIFFKDKDGSVPIIDWLDELPRKAQAKCIARIQRLRDLGHELRRPEADLLRDGIYELRVGLSGVNYRMLYFFHGKAVAVVAHGLTKQREVPGREIELAIRRKKLFETSPEKHTYEENMP
jgi:phage-related protein